MTYLKILAAVVLVAAGIGIGYWLFHHASVSFGSPSGTNFSDPKIASFSISPLGAAATTTYITNTDGSDRWIDGNAVVACTGVGSSQTYLTGTGLASWTLKAATTSSSVSGLGANTNFVLNMTLATSSATLDFASTTLIVGSALGTSLYDWGAGTNLAFNFNATNTAACIIKVPYTQS